jgi:hypothetical protein
MTSYADYCPISAGVEVLGFNLYLSANDTWTGAVVPGIGDSVVFNINAGLVATPITGVPASLFKITVTGPVLCSLAVFIGVGLIWPAKKPAADRLLKLINDEDVPAIAPPSHTTV